jgi:IclR family pca regulon transcriptional regulator
MKSKKPLDDEYIPSLEKGLSVIQLFSSARPEWTLSQISRELDLSPGSTRRILRTLEMLGLAVANEGRFRLTAKVLALGFAYLSSQPFSDSARPLLRELASRLDITCTIAVLDGSDVVYVARASNERFGHFYLYVGARFPAYATSSGKVLLAALPKHEFNQRMKGVRFEAFTPNTVKTVSDLRAQLPEIRDRGYSLNDQEIFLGQRSVSVPLRIGGAITAALTAASSVGLVQRHELVDIYLSELRAAAAEIEQAASVLL